LATARINAWQIRWCAEIHGFLEEWLKAIPDFRLDPDPDRPAHNPFRAVKDMDSLHLIWDPAGMRCPLPRSLKES